MLKGNKELREMEKELKTRLAGMTKTELIKRIDSLLSELKDAVRIIDELLTAERDLKIQ